MNTYQIYSKQVKVETKTIAFCCSIFSFLFLLPLIFLFASIKSAHAHGGSPMVSVGPSMEAVQQAVSPNVITCSRTSEHGDPHFSRDAFNLWFQETIKIDVRRFKQIAVAILN